MRQTRTVATMEVSRLSFAEVEGKLREAGYDHAFMPGGQLDMHGIALARGASELFSADVEAGSEGGWNECYGGTRFYTFDPRPEDVRITDIAHSLALQCRYNGNCRRFYSVAEHSCLLSDHVRWHDPAARPDAGDFFTERTQEALIALMHDAAEAYIGDLIRPVKHRMSQFKELEHLIEQVVFPVYDLPPNLPQWMKDLDSRILCDERRQVMLTQHNPWSTDQLRPLGVKVRFWSPARAEFEFLRRFYELTAGSGLRGVIRWRMAAGRARRKTAGARFWWGRC